MALFPVPQLDFTNKDFDSILDRLRNVIRSVFPTWSEENVANFGNILLESFAFIGDVLVFYQDSLARETRIVTATQRKALIALTKLIGFEPKTASAATTDETFTLAAVPVDDVVFVTGTPVRTSAVTDPVTFQLLADLTIPGGTDPPVGIGSVENSESVSDTFISTDTANQIFTLSRVPFLEDSAVIAAANGDYIEVDNFLDSTSTDRHFTLEVDEFDRATVRFGNGINGVIPSGTVVMNYKIGGGIAGNVEAGAINTIEGAFTDINGVPVQVTVTNVSTASGAAERESEAAIRQRAPETLRVLARAIAREDFEIVAEDVTGVARALMLTKNEDPSVAENTGNLFIVPEGGGPPSTALKDLVKAEFIGDDAPFPAPVTFTVIELDPVFLTIAVTATVFLRSNFTAAQTKADITTALTDFFAIRTSDGAKNTLIDFGFNFKDANGDPAGEIALSDVFNVVRDVAGVRKIGDLTSDFTLNGVHSDVTIALKEFPVLGTISLINGDTGNPL